MNRAILIIFPLDCRSIMTKKEIFHGIPGILRPFKEFIEKNGLKKGDQIVITGSRVRAHCLSSSLRLLSVRSNRNSTSFISWMRAG